LKEGRLQKQYPANFVLFDLDRPFVIDGDAFLSKCKNSPFNGKKVNASVLKTIRAGNIVFDINDTSID
jgi:dihydroorotase